MIKKKVVIFAIMLIVALGGLGSWWFIHSQKDKNYSVEETELETKVVIKENVEIEIMSDLLSPRYFFEEIGKDDDLEIIYYKDESTYEFTDKYNELGTYKVIIKSEEKEHESNLNVIDSISPTLELQEVTIKENETYDIKDFVKACNDNSEKECALEFSENKTYNKEGNYNIGIMAKDDSGNTTNGITKLNIEKKENNSTTNYIKNSVNKNSANKSSSNDTNDSININSSNSNNFSDNDKSNSNTSNSTNNKSLENEATFVETKKEVNTITEDYKYGIKVKKTVTSIYDLYSDGTNRDLKTTTTIISYDYSGFNATTNDLLAEANANRKIYANFVNSVFNYTNGYRAEVGASPLILDEALTKAAMVRAMEIAYTNKIEHKRPNGNSWVTTLKDLKISYKVAGENLAAYQANPKIVSEDWRNSSGHYANMINTNFKKIGIGIIKFNDRYYWVQLFSN